MSRLYNQMVNKGKMSGGIGITKTASDKKKVNPDELKSFADELKLISKQAKEEEEEAKKKEEEVVEVEPEEEAEEAEEVEEVAEEVEEGSDVSEDTEDADQEAEEIVEEAVQEATEEAEGEVEGKVEGEEELSEEEAEAMIAAAIESGEITEDDIEAFVQERENIKEAAVQMILEKLAADKEVAEEVAKEEAGVMSLDEIMQAIVECVETGEITPEQAEEMLAVVEEEKVASEYPYFYKAACMMKQAADEAVIDNTYNQVKDAVTQSILEEVAQEGAAQAEGEAVEGEAPEVDENFVAAVEEVSKEVVGEIMTKLQIDPVQYAGALVEDPEVAQQVAEGAEKIASENNVSVYSVINDIIESL